MQPQGVNGSETWRPLGRPIGSPSSGRLQVLALDGGGYRGMFAAALLACLEADLGVSIADHFDLVTGTSTGGLIALGLGAGLRPAALVDFYLTEGPAIFAHPRRRHARQVLRSKYPARQLRRALEEVFGERTLADSRVPLAIPSYDLCNDNVYLFRTPHGAGLTRDCRERMVDVALATTAAPTYLPAHQLRGLRLVDGGMWANNPTMVGLVEAVSTFGRELSEISVLSLGTTSDLAVRRDHLDRGGVLAWASQAISIVLRGQTIAAENSARLLLGGERLLRINPEVPSNVLRLDGISPDHLRGRVEFWSRRYSEQVRDMFLAHRATHPSHLPKGAHHV